MFASSLLAFAILADTGEPTSGPPVFAHHEKTAPWFDESSAYACSYARLVDKDPVWRVNITLPFRRTASLELQSTKRFGGEEGSRVFDLPPEGALVSIGDHASLAVDAPYYFGIGAIRYRFDLERSTLAAMQKAADDNEALGIAMPGVSEKPFDLQLDAATLATMQACQNSIGAKLMAARPEGEDPAMTDREPILRPEGKAGLQRIRYPSRALRGEEQGRVQTRLLIDRFGLPESCQVVSSSGFPYLDASTCRVLERYLKFYPALDSSGQATSGYVDQAVNWRIPE